MAKDKMPEKWKVIATFQRKVAEEWLSAADTKDLAVPFRFVALYSSFNAITWLWAGIDRVSRPEYHYIENVIGRLSDEAVQQVLAAPGAREASAYFSQRDPIRKMDVRTPDAEERATKVLAGARALLRDPRSTPQSTLLALGHIVYQVRCNLVHGSKDPCLDAGLLQHSCAILDPLCRAAARYTAESMR